MAKSKYTPGVFRNEKDISEVISPAGTSVGATVLECAKGISNSRVLVNLDKNLVEQFGKPNADSTDYNIYGGLEFLGVSDSLYVVRATSGAETYSNIVVSGSAVSGTGYNNTNTITEKSTTTLLAETGYSDGNTPTDISALEGNSFLANEKLLIASIGPGVYGDLVGVTLTTSGSSTELSGSYDWANSYDTATAGKVFKLDVYVKASTDDDSFPTTPKETFYVSNEYVKDSGGAQMYAEDIVNGNSNYIYVKVNDSGYPHEVHTSGLPVALANGADSSTTYATEVGDKTSAWSLFSDTDKVKLNILLGAYGHTLGGTVTAYVGNLASNRLDCIACIQNDDIVDDTTAEVIDNTITLTTGSYSAKYAGWDYYYDKYSDRKIYIPKCIAGAVAMAHTDNVAKTWDAPAGMNRGGISYSLGQNKVWTDTEIGLLYKSNINTSKFIRGTGDVLWGQKTAQTKKSALDRINVRRLLLFVENSIEPSLLPFLFESNSEPTRLRVTNIVDDFMEGVESGGGVTTYEVVCDETNNTSQVIDNNELVIDLYVQPTKTIEFIKLNVVITRSGVNFAEVR